MAAHLWQPKVLPCAGAVRVAAPLVRAAQTPDPGGAIVGAAREQVARGRREGQVKHARVVAWPRRRSCRLRTGEKQMHDGLETRQVHACAQKRM